MNQLNSTGSLLMLVVALMKVLMSVHVYGKIEYDCQFYEYMRTRISPVLITFMRLLRLRALGF